MLQIPHVTLEEATCIHDSILYMLMEDLACRRMSLLRGGLGIVVSHVCQTSAFIQEMGTRLTCR